VRVAVLMGGRSSEHEISVASARSVLEALDPERYEAVAIEIGRDGRWGLPAPAQAALVGARAELEAELGDEDDDERTPVETLPVPASSAVPATLADVEVVLPVLHGPFGEDGTVQGLLELAGVPYVGAGVAASAVCMDKDLFKKICRDSGIPVARHVALRPRDAIENPFGYPVFVKPARLGSSVGISKVRDLAELEPAVRLARRHDEKVLVEEFVEGVEIEVGVLGNRSPIASLPGQVVSHYADWYDYASKYEEGGSELLVPPPGLDDGQIERAQQLAVDAFVATDCEGMARADFFVRADNGEVVVNELNTIPGFTATSFYARLFDASGIPYAELLDRLVELALERHERRARLEY
jgi:D-alanine-D-alanine ligase